MFAAKFPIPLIKKVYLLLREMDIRPKELVIMSVLTLSFTVLESVGMGVIYLILGFLENGREGLLEVAPKLIATTLLAMESAGIPLTLGVLAVVVGLLLLIRQAINFYRTYYGMLLQIRGTATLHKMAANKYLDADMSYYLFNNRTDIMYVTKLLSGRAAGLVNIITTSLSSLLLILVYLVLLVAISPLSFLLLLPALPLVLVAYRKTLKMGQHLGARNHVALRAWVETMHEAVNGARLIKMRRMEAPLKAKVSLLVDEEAQTKKELQKVNSFVEATILPLILLAALGVLYVARTYAGMGFATLGVFALIILRIAPQLSVLGRTWAGVGNTLQAFDKYHEGLALADRFQELPHGDTPFGRLQNSIRFESVSYSYDPEGQPVQALSDLNLTIPAKSTVALVGPSGAGKSTLVDMLPGFLRASSGRILFDGEPLEQYDIGTLRRGIALVSQDPVMFDDTIRNNVIFGVETEDEAARLDDALKQAHCDFVQDLPQGVDSQIGEMGVRLSGGQRQRLALARALYQKPEILILDEPTSALDSASEVAIQRSLEELHGQITILIIAHRLSTVRRADIIHVLEHGCVTASGTHQELVNQGGLYSMLFRLQAGSGLDGSCAMSEEG